MIEPKKPDNGFDDIDFSMVVRVMKSALVSKKYVLGLALNELAKLHIEDNLAKIGETIVRPP